MPLPMDEKLISLSEALLAEFNAIFGLHPGFRPAHAKGLMVNGTFTPSPEAPTYTKAVHFNQPVTPVMARFSNSTGLPLIPDSDPNAGPRGLGLRFALAEHVHTDVIAHSTDGFPTRTGEEFLEMLKALATSPPGTASPSPIESFLGAHPAALAFVQAPKPAPLSFATENYFGVTAVEFEDASGKKRFARYRVTPEAGLAHLSAGETEGKGGDYLFEELKSRIASQPVVFALEAQLAGDGDVVDDATVHWPESREVARLGTIRLDQLTAENEAEQKRIIFDPIPRLAGIAPSNDPLLELRAAVYLISGRRRRAA